MAEAPLKILAVEPNSQDLLAFRASLEEAGTDWFDLDQASDVYTAMDRLEEETYDAILFAWGIRGASIDNIKRLHASSPSAAILIMTSVHDSIVSVKAVRAGAEDCFVKGSIGGKSLKNLIRSAAERQKIATKSHTDAILRHRRLEALLRTDELTGLSNALHFSQRVDQEILRSVRYKRPLSLAFVHIEGAAGIRDTHGQAFLDQLVVILARLIQENSRKIDETARIKDHKFALLLIETGAVPGQIAANRILAAARQRPIPAPVGAPIYLSLSCGLAQWDSSITEAAGLINIADQALALASKEGGDCVRMMGVTTL